MAPTPRYEHNTSAFGAYRCTNCVNYPIRLEGVSVPLALRLKGEINAYAPRLLGEMTDYTPRHIGEINEFHFHLLSGTSFSLQVHCESFVAPTFASHCTGGMIPFRYLLPPAAGCSLLDVFAHSSAADVYRRNMRPPALLVIKHATLPSLSSPMQRCIHPSFQVVSAISGLAGKYRPLGFN